MPQDRRTLRAQLQRDRQQFAIRLVVAATGEELEASLLVWPGEAVAGLLRRIESLGHGLPLGHRLALVHGSTRLSEGATLRQSEVKAGETLAVVRVKERLLLSGSFDRTLRLWDVNLESQEPTTLLDATRAVVALAADLATQRILVGFSDGGLELLPLRCEGDLQRLQAFAGHEAAVTSVAAIWGRDRAVSASFDCSLAVWDLAGASMLPVYRLLLHEQQVLFVTAGLTPEGYMRCASASADGMFALWDLEAGSRLQMVRERGDAGVMVVDVDWSTSRLVSGTDSGIIRLWQLGGGGCEPGVAAGTRTFTGHEQAVWTLAVKWRAGTGSSEEPSQPPSRAMGALSTASSGNKKKKSQQEENNNDYNADSDAELLLSAGADGKIRL
eukprot:CAMPEP_0115121272 /NCGR_PEP_ID=MMETSP0227-20121206/46156_1 /TAXON_ID=89957 /ORGANISM="Polarella glacialis, Strain CCMP 1383" /LENGTH=384 /DNA_ID=CAMNT_0002523037 /DNA_START=79 /DNA_END=1233 /DNA_ORIENTATION=+